MAIPSKQIHWHILNMATNVHRLWTNLYILKMLMDCNRICPVVISANVRCGVFLLTHQTECRMTLRQHPNLYLQYMTFSIGYRFKWRAYQICGHVKHMPHISPNLSWHLVHIPLISNFDMSGSILSAERNPRMKAQITCCGWFVNYNFKATEGREPFKNLNFGLLTMRTYFVVLTCVIYKERNALCQHVGLLCKAIIII